MRIPGPASSPGDPHSETSIFDDTRLPNGRGVVRVGSAVTQVTMSARMAILRRYRDRSVAPGLCVRVGRFPSDDDDLHAVKVTPADGQTALTRTQFSR